MEYTNSFTDLIGRSVSGFFGTNEPQKSSLLEYQLKLWESVLSIGPSTDFQKAAVKGLAPCATFSMYGDYYLSLCGPVTGFTSGRTENLVICTGLRRRRKMTRCNTKNA